MFVKKDEGEKKLESKANKFTNTLQRRFNENRFHGLFRL